MEYTVIVEKSDTGFGAFVPDLPGCVAVGETREETLVLVREAIRLHLESLEEQGDPVPEPRATAERVAEVHVKAPSGRPISDEAAAVAASTLATPDVGWRVFQWLVRSVVPDPTVVG